VRLVSMRKVLEKLSESQIEGYQDVERNMKFLFTTCNQKKLISKIKGRNLKHNIANIKMRIDKQYALDFAVKVAKMAESIAKDS